VSLRGGTTKQPVSFLGIILPKFIEIDQLFHKTAYLGKVFGSQITGCFVVPPRNDTLTLGLNFVGSMKFLVVFILSTT
jgi:hypothetical protein